MLPKPCESCPYLAKVREAVSGNFIIERDEIIHFPMWKWWKLQEALRWKPPDVVVGQVAG